MKWHSKEGILFYMIKNVDKDRGNNDNGAKETSILSYGPNKSFNAFEISFVFVVFCV